MNTTKRYLFGFFSSALLAVGLARAADLLDPMSRTLPGVSQTIAKSAPDTSTNCYDSLFSASDTVSNTSNLTDKS